MSLSVRGQKMALLVLRRVGLCVGQNQMCHLCGWLKIELKKCAVGKIKNTEGSAMSVGSVAVQLKYGLYVGHLSKLAFHFMFKVVRLVVVVSSVRLACNSLIPVAPFRSFNVFGCIGDTKLRLLEVHKYMTFFIITYQTVKQFF
jgi:hypothetical protein